MNGDTTTLMEPNTCALVETLSQLQDDISWAPACLDVYNLIQRVFDVYNSGCDPPTQARALLIKVKELEQYLTFDIERHVASSDGRTPYHLTRISNHLTQAVSLFEQSVKGQEPKSWDCSPEVSRQMNHLAAELQATFNEYGFCHILDAIYNVDEAGIKIDSVVSKLDNISKFVNNSGKVSRCIIDLHDAYAAYHGILESMTENNIARLQRRFDDLDRKITAIEKSICDSVIRPDSALFMGYLAAQSLLTKSFMQSLTVNDYSNVVNDHMIHPGTRGWVLERFQRFLDKTPKRIYYVAGKQGSGKTALSSAVCKLHRHQMAACHFFNSQTSGNNINNLIQSIAGGLCRTCPEYLNYLDDKYGNSDLSTIISQPWKELYNKLIKEPIQDLFGFGKTANPNAERKFILIDGVDECIESDWPQIQQFLTAINKDLSPCFCLFITCRTKFLTKILVFDDEYVEGLKFEDRAWANRHIKDIEVYLSGSLGAILSGEDDVDRPNHAKSDAQTLQNTVDELLKGSAGRFDYAIQLMTSFAKEMTSSGQFLVSLRRALQPFRESLGTAYEEKTSEFASPYRSYRDKEGRSVDVRVLHQSHYRMDKTRVALIRGRHKIHELN